MKLPEVTAESSLMPATQQYITYSKKSESFLAPQMKAREHSVPKIQYAMNEDGLSEDRAWTYAMRQEGISWLHIVANIIRWEDYKSLFSIVQVGGENGTIFAFASGEGDATGLYSWGKYVKNPRYRVTWEDLFKSYGIEVKVQVERYKKGTSMDGEERMVKYFQRGENKPLVNQSLHIVTAASPCNKKCANLLAQWVKTFKPSSVKLEYISAYTNQSLQDFKDSIQTLRSANINVSPVPLTMIDKSIFLGVKDQKKRNQYLQSIGEINRSNSGYTLEYDLNTGKIKEVQIPQSLLTTN